MVSEGKAGAWVADRRLCDSTPRAAALSTAKAEDGAGCLAFGAQFPDTVGLTGH